MERTIFDTLLELVNNKYIKVRVGRNKRNHILRYSTRIWKGYVCRIHKSMFIVPVELCSSVFAVSHFPFRIFKNIKKN